MAAHAYISSSSRCATACGQTLMTAASEMLWTRLEQLSRAGLAMMRHCAAASYVVKAGSFSSQPNSLSNSSTISPFKLAWCCRWPDFEDRGFRDAVDEARAARKGLAGHDEPRCCCII